MDSMVERIAKAILPEIGKRELVMADPATLDRLAAMRIARAAISAMMEPTDDMLDAGCHARSPEKTRWDNSLATWQTMIAAALSDTEGR